MTWRWKFCATFYVLATLFAGCAVGSRQSALNPNVPDGFRSNVRLATATATPYRIQIIDIGHGLRDIVYDSYATSVASPASTNTPYVVGQAMNLVVSNPNGQNPINVTWTNGDGQALGYLVYNYPSPSVIKTSGAITLSVPQTGSQGATPPPYAKYALTGSGTVQVSGYSPDGSTYFYADASIPITAPTVVATTMVYDETYVKASASPTSIPELASVGPLEPDSARYQ